jgi:hypothetical protein
MKMLPKALTRLKQEAKKLKKEKDIPQIEAIEIIAKQYGFLNWHAVLEAFKSDQDDDLNTEAKINLADNKKFFASQGIDFSIFEPTATGLKKSILDATAPVRAHLAVEKFHYFDQQKQGQEFKVVKKAYFVSQSELKKTRVSLYRPETKNGDPRFWFTELGSYASPQDQIAIIVFDDSLYLFNVSQIKFRDFDSNTEGGAFFSRYVQSKNNISEELLGKLRVIAKHPIKSVRSGDTAIGMAIEAALGIAANSSKKPDYKGIELKSGRVGKNRTTLFAQIANWSLSACKSSAEILNKYGYVRENGDTKLYCTISSTKPNSQGLQFFYDASVDQLIEKHNGSEIVAIWSGDVLRTRLLEKHAETFWVNAKSYFIDGIEHFDLVSVTHTKQPLVSQLLPLIEAGIVTMDHLIKRKSGTSAVSEKGPLFKVNKSNLALLFPEPKTYSLK